MLSPTAHQFLSLLGRPLSPEHKFPRSHIWSYLKTTGIKDALTEAQLSAVREIITSKLNYNLKLETLRGVAHVLTPQQAASLSDLITTQINQDTLILFIDTIYLTGANDDFLTSAMQLSEEPSSKAAFVLANTWSFPVDTTTDIVDVPKFSLLLDHLINDPTTNLLPTILDIGPYLKLTAEEQIFSLSDYLNNRPITNLAEED